jgi:hypothetical protein
MHQLLPTQPAFGSVATITQLEIENGKPLYGVEGYLPDYGNNN